MTSPAVLVIIVGLVFSCSILGFSVDRMSKQLTERVDGMEPTYLLMSVGKNYTTDRKMTWMVVYKNSDKKECVFKEVDDSTADSLVSLASREKKEVPSSPTRLAGLLVIDDTNISSHCDGLATRYL